MCKNLGESGVVVVPVQGCGRGVDVLVGCVEHGVGYDGRGSWRDREIEKSKRGDICLLFPLIVSVPIGWLLDRTLYLYRVCY